MGCPKLPPGWNKTPAELASCIDGYFAGADGVIYETKYGKRQPKLYTRAGLARHIGLNQSQQLSTLVATPRFKKMVEQALLRVEERQSELLIDPENRNARGSEFSLKNGFAWQDKQTLDVSGTARIIRLPTRKAVGAPVGRTLTAG